MLIWRWCCCEAGGQPGPYVAEDGHERRIQGYLPGCPRSNPSIERSSSSFSQWIPMPLPINLQDSRTSEEAFRNLGNHSKGIESSRPSSSVTNILSFLKLRSVAFTGRSEERRVGQEGTARMRT